MLHAFKAIHEYEVDTVHITGNGVSTTIYNQNRAELTKAEEHEDKVKETTTTQVNILDNETEVFTRTTDPMNPKRVAYIVKAVQLGDDLSPKEREKVKELISQYADVFACSLSEVLLVPGAEHHLNIPQDATFRLRVHQKALTPPQAQFPHSRIDEMLTAGIIEKAPPEAVKCCATTVLAQKAH
ncbi:hypothetical protein BDR05DRAFT_879154, partial [Suillus weaverae]